MATDAWRRQKVPLKAYVGDLPILPLSLELMVCDQHFMTLPDEVDFSRLPPLNPACQGYLIRSCPTRPGSWRLRRTRDHLLYAPRRYQRYWVALNGHFDDYLAALSGKTRSTLKRKLRKFDTDSGGLDFRIYKTPEALDAFHAMARQVSEKSYQERLMDSGLPTEPTFLEEMQRRAADDQVRAYILFHRGTPVAYTYCPIDDGILIYDHTGFDPAYRHLSPGTVLQLLILESLFAEERFDVFDFTEGEGAHKALFGTDCRTCMDLYILRRSLAAVGSVVTQTAIERSAEFLADGFERIGVKRRLKSLLRNA